jgi:hypothetical protein
MYWNACKKIPHVAECFIHQGYSIDTTGQPEAPPHVSFITNRWPINYIKKTATAFMLMPYKRVAFDTAAVGTNPPHENVFVTNDFGRAVISTLAEPAVVYNAGEPTGWLFFSVIDTSVSHKVQIIKNKVNSAGLAAGTYTATVTIATPECYYKDWKYEVKLVISDGTGINRKPEIVTDNGKYSIRIPKNFTGNTVTVKIYNVAGRIVQAMDLPVRGGGYIAIPWNVRSLDRTRFGSGVYFIQVDFGSEYRITKAFAL